MSAQAKPAHKKRRKPISETHQTLIAGTATVLLIAGLIVVFGVYVPMQPLPDKPLPRLSLQETRR